jgi:hypothetical protein
LVNFYLVIGVGLLILIIILFLYFYLRDSPKNNLRRAKKHHRLAIKNYESENFEESKEHYLLSNHYRERAEKQIKGEN